MTYNHDQLQWQFDYRGPNLQNLRILVCPSCLDVPQQQLRTILIPPDPIPIENPRPGEFGSMVISSSPNPYATIVPNNLTTDSTNYLILGDQLTTESSDNIILEAAVTPTPTSSGYIDDVTG